MSYIVAHSFYNLFSPRAHKWTANQEKTIAKDFPFINIRDETPDQYLVRNYLQYLWLPQSIMPLEFLVPSLQRVQPASSSSQHPLHSLLEPILLTPRTTANKYQVELSQIMADNGGAGEVEEAMMWYVLGYEKVDEDASNPEGDASEHWKRNWLKRMEQREVQVQILLYMLKLSLPPPPSPDTVVSPKKRKHGKQTDESKPPPPPEDTLESFMDKLSMWQLVESLNPNHGLQKDSLDWTQAFCERIVEPQFKTVLPEFCELLRSKLFRTSPNSDDSRSSRSPSPEPKPTKPRAGSTIRETEVIKASSTRSLSRVRSRSLSVSLAQDEKERAASVGLSKRRPLNREVSMSRVFKAKPKPQENMAAATTVKQVDKTKVAKKSMRDFGRTLVEETPEKPKVLARTKVPTRAPTRATLINSQTSITVENDDDEEIWELPTGSPLLRSISEEDEPSLSLKRSRYPSSAMDTPSKRPRGE